MKKSSLFIFSVRSCIRLRCFKIISNQWFENFILIIILVSSVTLGFDNPLENPDSSQKRFLSFMDVFFTILFTIEMILKVISLGFFYNYHNPTNSDYMPKAYIRNPWNILDFVVVVTSIIDKSGLTNISGLKALRTLRSLRALRPLKMVAKNENLKFLVDAIFGTIPLLGTLLFVSGIIMWIFAILMMAMQKGTMHFCSIEGDLLHNIDTK